MVKTNDKMVNVSTKNKNLPFIKNLIAGGDYVRLIKVEPNVGTWYFVQDTNTSIYLLFDSTFIPKGMAAFKTPFIGLQVKNTGFFKITAPSHTIEVIMDDLQYKTKFNLLIDPIPIYKNLEFSVYRSLTVHHFSFISVCGMPSYIYYN